MTPDTQNCAFRTDFLLTAVKILTQSNFLKDLWKTAFVIVFAGCLMMVNGSQTFGPINNLYLKPFQLTSYWKLLLPKSSAVASATRTKHLNSAQFLIHGCHLKTHQVNWLCWDTDFYSQNGKTVASEPNTVFLRTSLTHTTYLSLCTTPFLLCQRISLFLQFHALLLRYVLLRLHPKSDLPKDL